jgi:hypothetical protein
LPVPEVWAQVDRKIREVADRVRALPESFLEDRARSAEGEGEVQMISTVIALTGLALVVAMGGVSHELARIAKALETAIEPLDEAGK